MRRRWRVQFGLGTLAIFVAVVAFAFGWPHIWRLVQFQRLRSYVGQDLRTLPDEEQTTIANRVDRLLGRDSNPLQFLFGQSWYIWEAKTASGSPLVILFEGVPLVSIPGSSGAKIHLFNGYGHLLSSTEFSTGWRVDIEDAKWEAINAHGFPCLTIKTAPNINGADIATQYYALIGTGWGLVRLEDSDGKSQPVDYHAPNHTIGPPIPKLTIDHGVAALRSPDRGEVLRALAWLGGNHTMRSIRNPGNVGIEDFHEAERVAEHRSEKNVRLSVQQLTHDSDIWVRDAARMALSQIEPELEEISSAKE